MTPPPIGRKEPITELDLNSVSKAIETVKKAAQFFTAGIPIVRRGPAGEIHVDVPVMYMDFAVDRIHYDPVSKMPSPKGRPVGVYGDINPEEVRREVEGILREIQVIEAAEFREPERAWVIPVVWNRLIVMHVKVSQDGGEIVPDYGLTEEVRRHV